MKIQQKHYDELKESVKSVIEYNGYDKVLKYYENLKQCKDVNDARVRLMYDLKVRSLNNSYITSILYEYMNDKHITTALLKIGHDLNLF